MMTRAVDGQRVTAPNDILNTEILVIGAGVLGLCTAVELRRRGHGLRVLDPGGPNASSVAAGMIAPALESAIDDVTPERAALLRDARALWDAFAPAAGLALSDGPAVWRGDGAQAMAHRLGALGFDFDHQGDVVLAADDARIDAAAAMTTMQQGLGDALVVGRALEMSRHEGRWRVRTGERTLEADVVVLATGAAGAIPGLPDPVPRRVAAIEPIRGQIGRVAQRLTARVMRGPGAYVAPAAGGAVIGATMEPGRRDLEPDVATGAGLLAAASRLLGQDVSDIAVDWRVGVRGSTADGLPMAGPSGAPGLYLALAPRRNGWLLGPLAAATVADAIEGRAPGPRAAALDPSRFQGLARA